VDETGTTKFLYNLDRFQLLHKAYEYGSFNRIQSKEPEVETGAGRRWNSQ